MFNSKFSVPAAIIAACIVSTAAIAEPVKLAEGTEIKVTFDQTISSATNVQGDTFTISLADPINLGNGVVIPAGFKGRGEVSAAEKRGMMGRGGELNVRLEYIRIGETRVPLRGNRASEGANSTGSTIALTVLFGPLGLLKRGKDITINSGQTITAFVDGDVMIETPVAAPPKNQIANKFCQIVPHKRRKGADIGGL